MSAFVGVLLALSRLASKGPTLARCDITDVGPAKFTNVRPTLAQRICVTWEEITDGHLML